MTAVAKRTVRLFAPFSKVTKNDDGTVQVDGIASSETRDHDGEMISADAMRKAIPDYMTFGAVREMHQKIAAGTALSAKVNTDGVTEFSALIVDEGSVKKVLAGVLKGFSVGGKITKRNSDDKTIIEGVNLTEISLVDRPANPDATFTLVKFDKDGRPIQKSMYDVSRLADLLCSLHYLQQSCEAEAIYEKDESPVPAKLRGVVEDTVGILKELLDEETAELLGLGKDLAQMAAKSSPFTRTQHATLEKVLSELAELRKTAKQGAPVDAQEKETLEKAQRDAKDAGDKLTKALEEKKTAEDNLTKVTGERDTAIAAHKKTEGELTEVTKASEALVDSLKAKGHLKVVTKSGDTGTAPVKSKEELEKEAKDPVSLVKSAFASPIHVSPIGTTK